MCIARIVCWYHMEGFLKSGHILIEQVEVTPVVLLIFLNAESTEVIVTLILQNDY